MNQSTQGAQARSAPPANRVEPIPEMEWCFDAVPREELLACCRWEYARESARFMASREYLHRRVGEAVQAPVAVQVTGRD